MNIFYQLIGFGALIAMGLSYWQNDKRTILLWQVVANLIFAIVGLSNILDRELCWREPVEGPHR